MRSILIAILSLVATVSAAAQTTDVHAGHHPDGPPATQTPPRADVDHHCPMMKDKGQAMAAGTMPQDHAMPGDHGEHCMMRAPDHQKGEKK